MTPMTSIARIILFVLTVSASACYSLPVAANPYRINGFPAPQVKPNPIASQLQKRLNELQQQLKARARKASLQECIEQSLLNNPKLAEAYRQIQADEWILIGERRQWYPQLSANSAGPVGDVFGFSSTTNARLNSNQAGFKPYATYGNTTQASTALTLSWTFFDPSRSPSIDSASENLRSQKLLFNVAARNLVLETQLSFFNLQEQQQLIRSYQDILNTTNTEVRRTEELFNNGAVSIGDVEQIRAQQYQNLNALIDTYAQLVDASSALAQAMALPPGTLILVDEKPITPGAWELLQDATIRQALALREEIQASLAQSSSASWNATALFNQYWPRFSLAASGSYAYQNEVNGQTGVPLSLNSEQENWSGAIGVGFNWSIFDGGINAAQAEASKAQARQLQDQAALQRLQVSREVEQAYANYQASELSMASSAQQLIASMNAVKATRARFNVGITDMTSVVQTLNQAIVAANAKARSQRLYASAVASLYRYSAQWPEGALPMVHQREAALQK